MKAKKAAGILAAALGGTLALIWAAWLIAVPSELITGKISEAIQETQARVEFEGFSKGAFFSVKSDGLRVLSAASGREIVYLEKFRAGLNVPSVFSLNPHLDFSSVLSGGMVKGKAAIDGTLSMNAKNVDLASMGIERLLTGLRAGGVVSFDINAVKGNGEARFLVDEMSFLPYRYMGFSLPLDLLKNARGIVKIENGSAKVESATLEGEGIYARAKGSIGGGKVDMRLELMPSEALEKSQPYFGMLQSYRVAKGFYDIPLRTSY